MSSTDFLVPYLNRLVYPSLTRHFVPSALKTSPYFSPAICGSFAYLATAQKERLGRINTANEIDKRKSLQHADDTHIEAGKAKDGQASALPVWIQYGGVENLHVDIENLIERMRADGVEVEVDRVEGGVHLDAGIAFALGERSKESSWVRLCDAVRRFTK